LPPADPAEAVDILSHASPIENYLPALKEALVAPSVSNDTLVELVARRARRGVLEGALVAALARERPAAAAAIPSQIGSPPTLIRQTDLILSEMQRDRATFDVWGDFMFDALASNWDDIPGPGHPAHAERFFALLRERDPGFLCERLDRITREGGVLDYRERKIIPAAISANPYEAMPGFLRPLINAAVSQCGERATSFLRDLLAARAAIRRREIALLVSQLPRELAKKLEDQAFANLLDDRGMDYLVYDSLERQRQRYVEAHVQLLLQAGQSCDEVQRKVDAAIAELRGRGGTPPPQVLERLVDLDRKEPGGPLKCKLG
jgi:hypothetical protein